MDEKKGLVNIMDDRKRDQIRNLSSNKLSDLTQAASRAAMNGDRNAACDLTMAAMYKAKKEYGMDPSDYMKPKKGCFITSAVCESFGKPDDCYELTMFRSFRDNYLAKEQDGEDLIRKYYRIAPWIVEKINELPNANSIYLSIWREYLLPCLTSIEQKDYITCKKKYVQMVEELFEKFRA